MDDGRRATDDERAAPSSVVHCSLSAALALLQLSDSFFPTGMFAHSLGLESMVRRGRVQSLADVEEFMLATLTQAVITSDGVALSNAHRAVRAGVVDELCAMDRRLHLMKASLELRSASQQHGRRLLTETASFTDNDTLRGFRTRALERKTPGTGAVALGAVCAALGIKADLGLSGYIHGYTVGIVSAAIRLLPISNSDCQLMMHRLHERIGESMDGIRDRPWQEMSAFAPQLEIASMGHVYDDVRMFAS